MAVPQGIGIIDTMIGFPHGDIKRRTSSSPSRRRTASRRTSSSSRPSTCSRTCRRRSCATSDDPIEVTLAEMDRWGVENGMIGVGDETGTGVAALKRHPDRFIASTAPTRTRAWRRSATSGATTRSSDIRAVGAVPVPAPFPQVAINDKQMYPIYAKCVELGIAVFCCAGVPGPRLRMAPQRVELIDEVMYDFPELTFVTRHGCEPWQDLAVKLMLKWPNLYYSTSAFAPKHYPKAIVDYANTRGADKVIYAGYFPMGLSLERIMTEMPNVGFKDEVWPKFLRDNAAKVLKLQP